MSGNGRLGRLAPIEFEPYLPSSDGSPCPVEGKGGYRNVPDGFMRYVVRSNDTLRSICGSDEARQWLFLRVNRIDEDHLTVGMSVLVPVDMMRASRYMPIPVTNSYRGPTIVVYRRHQWFGVYDGGKLRAWGPVCTGKSDADTPLGKYWIDGWLEVWDNESWNRAHPDKKTHLDPKLFSMFMRLSGADDVYLHVGPLAGEKASKGCIRVLRQDGNVLFPWTRGTRVLAQIVDVVERN